MYINIGENTDVASAGERILGAMGLAKRAGKLVIGAQMCEETIRAGKAVLTLLCSDMSENSQKKLHAALKIKNSPYIVLPSTKEELAKRFGKKAYVVSCVITDMSFIRIICKALGIAENDFLHESK